MNLSELRDLIRAEANINGLDEYSNLIDNLINQELQRLSGKSKYTELLFSVGYAATVLEEHSFDLPSDYQLFDYLAFTRYNDPDPQHIVVLDKGISQGLFSRPNGTPQFYIRGSATFTIYPYTEIVIGDSLLLSYYKRPELLDDDDLFPVPSLESVVQLYVIARMWRMKDTARSREAFAAADRAYRDSRSEYAGN